MFFYQLLDTDKFMSSISDSDTFLTATKQGQTWIIGTIYHEEESRGIFESIVNCKRKTTHRAGRFLSFKRGLMNGPWLSSGRDGAAVTAAGGAAGRIFGSLTNFNGISPFITYHTAELRNQREECCWWGVVNVDIQASLALFSWTSQLFLYSLCVLSAVCLGGWSP